MTVPRETVEEEDSLFTLTLNAMRSLDKIAVPIDHVRVSQIGVEGGPVTYLTPENRGVVLLHPRDWQQIWLEATQSGLFGLAATRPATGDQEIWGVPVKIDGEEQRPRPTPPTPRPPEQPQILTCSSFRAIFKGQVPVCCSSCHEEQDNYGYQLPWGGSPRVPGVELEVCCSVGTWITDRPDGGAALTREAARA